MLASLQAISVTTRIIYYSLLAREELSNYASVGDFDSLACDESCSLTALGLDKEL